MLNGICAPTEGKRTKKKRFSMKTSESCTENSSSSGGTCIR